MLYRKKDNLLLCDHDPTHLYPRFLYRDMYSWEFGHNVVSEIKKAEENWSQQEKGGLPSQLVEDLE